MTQLLEQQSLLSTGEEDVRQFLKEIRRYPLLTAQQEQELARRSAGGDQEAIRHLVNSNLRLVVSIAREYTGRGVALLDLIQEGSIGLLAAARKFDHTMQTRFSTYATKWIRQGVTRCLLNHGCLIRVPVHTRERMIKATQARAQLLQEQDVQPTLAQIAQRSGIPEDKIEELFRLSPEVCSLDIPTGSEEEDTLAMLLEDVSSPQPQEELVRRELERTLELLLGMLEERQQRILRLHFGLEDGCCHSLEQIAKQLGLSKERVRQIERQAMERLQAMGASMGLEEFLE